VRSYACFHIEGIDLNTAGEKDIEDGRTCLHATRSLDTASALLAEGADPNVTDVYNTNALGHAIYCAYINLPLIDVLLQHGSVEKTQDLVSHPSIGRHFITRLVRKVDLWSSKLTYDISDKDFVFRNCCNYRIL